MKKIAKIFGAIAAIGAAVAGGVALYKKFISPNENFEDPDDELDEDFFGRLEALYDPDTADRSYVSLTPSEESTAKEEDAEEETAKAPESEDAPAAEEAAEAEEKEI